jgi:hypothetical protein
MSGPQTDVKMQLGDVALMLILGIALPTADVVSDIWLTFQLFNGTTRNILLFNNATYTYYYGDTTTGEYSKYLMTSHFSNCL